MPSSSPYFWRREKWSSHCADMAYGRVSGSNLETYFQFLWLPGQRVLPFHWIGRLESVSPFFDVSLSAGPFLQKTTKATTDLAEDLHCWPLPEVILSTCHNKQIVVCVQDLFRGQTFWGQFLPAIHIATQVFSACYPFMFNKPRGLNGI